MALVEVQSSGRKSVRISRAEPVEPDEVKLEAEPDCLFALAERFHRLQAETAMAGWDQEGAEVIPAREWEQAFGLCTTVYATLPALPIPFPSPCGDGSIHLQWETPSRRLIVELRGGEARWSRRIGTQHSHGTIERTVEAVVELLLSTFS